MGTKDFSKTEETELDAPTNSSRHEGHSTPSGSEGAMVFKNSGPVKIPAVLVLNGHDGNALNFNNDGCVDIAKDVIALGSPTSRDAVTADFNNNGDVKVGGNVKVVAEAPDREHGGTALKVRQRVSSFTAEGDAVVVIVAENIEKAKKKLQMFADI
jgi:hypothetical protein